MTLERVMMEFGRQGFSSGINQLKQSIESKSINLWSQPMCLLATRKVLRSYSMLITNSHSVMVFFIVSTAKQEFIQLL